jgi:hypothetical protein
MKKTLLFIFLVSGLTGSAQEYYNDAQLWLNLCFEKEVTKAFDIRLKFQNRFNQNVSELGRAYVDIGLTYKINKHIKLMADYAYVQKRSNSGLYRPRHVGSAAVLFRKDIKFLSFIYRNMLQARFIDPYNSKAGYVGYYFDRNKFTVRYELTKRFSLYVAGEVYVPLNDPLGFAISRTRSYLGTIIDLTRSQQLELFFMYQMQLRRSDWFDQDNDYPNTPFKRYYVYGVTYKISF